MTRCHGTEQNPSGIHYARANSYTRYTSSVFLYEECKNQFLHLVNQIGLPTLWMQEPILTSGIPVPPSYTRNARTHSYTRNTSSNLLYQECKSQFLHQEYQFHLPTSGTQVSILTPGIPVPPSYTRNTRVNSYTRNTSFVFLHQKYKCQFLCQEYQFCLPTTGMQEPILMPGINVQPSYTRNIQESILTPGKLIPPSYTRNKRVKSYTSNTSSTFLH